MVIIGTRVTLNVAACDVALRPPLLTTARNLALLSVACAVKEKVPEFVPTLLHVLPLSFDLCHCQFNGVAPVAAALNVTVFPAVTVLF